MTMMLRDFMNARVGRTIAIVALFTFPTAFAQTPPNSAGGDPKPTCEENHYILSEPCDPSHWTAIGPDGAWLLSLAIDPTDASTVYAGTLSSGVLKSTDAGVTWSASPGLKGSYVHAVAIDPFVPSTIYAGTGAGVFRSEDGGRSWVAAGNGLPIGSISALKVDPFSPATAYAAAAGGAFKTTDGAQSWTALAAFPDANARFIYFIELDPESPGTIYIGTDAGMFRSVDSGASWKSFFSCGFLGSDTPALAFDPQQPSRIYVLCWGDDYDGWPAGLLVSLDKGATWSWRSTPAVAPQTLVVDSSSAVYVGDFWGGAYRARNPGESTSLTWTPMSFAPGPGPVNVNAIASPAGIPTIYAATNGGFFRSADGGGTWERSILGVKNLSVGQLAVDPTSPSTLYVGTAGARVMKTTDGGMHWSDASFGPPGPWFTSLTFDPNLPSRLYAAAGNAVYTSADVGAHWSVSGSAGSPPYGWAPLIAVSSSLPSTVYVSGGSPGRVSKSIDAGITWQRASGDLPADLPSIVALAVDPTSPETVFVATKTEFVVTGRGHGIDPKVFTSRDGGNHWSSIPVPFPAGSFTSSIAIDPSTPSTIYVSAYVYGSADQPGYSGVILKSLDAGESWLAPQYLPFPSVVLAIHPSRPSQVYVGTTHGGVLRSLDGGVSWAPLGAGFAPDSISQLLFDSAGRLRAATSAGLFEFGPDE